MDPIERLTELFEKFPGIGPRQAQRFVQFLLRASSGTRRELADTILSLSAGVHQCASCMRYFAGKNKACGICTNAQRDAHALVIVASDADLAALERSGTYHGRYFVLGGTLSLASEKAAHLRLPQLVESLSARVAEGLTEVILAFPANPEGDATAERTHEDLAKAFAKLGAEVRISSLGRGLSTGSELEYADPETLRSALDNRK